MADADVLISAGTGTKIDTRTVGAGVDEHRQVVVIGDPATAADVASATAANGLDVDVTRVIPGTGATDLGKAEDAVHATGDTGVMMLGVANANFATLASAEGDYTPFAVDLVGRQYVIALKDRLRISVASAGLTTATTAYVTGDQMGTIFTLPNAARVTGGYGVITGVAVISAADITGAMDVIFHRATATLAGDNAAYAISDADALNVVDVVQLGTSIDIGNNRIARATGLAIPYDCSGGTSLFASLRTQVGHTFFAAVTDLQLVVFVERD